MHGVPRCTYLFANRRVRYGASIPAIRVTKILQTKVHANLGASRHKPIREPRRSNDSPFLQNASAPPRFDACIPGRLRSRDDRAAQELWCAFVRTALRDHWPQPEAEELAQETIARLIERFGGNGKRLVIEKWRRG